MKRAYQEKDYYLGLDMGTAGTGWAVTDPKYDRLKFNGKSMWGIRLFDEADPAKERRLKRVNRRRLQRRVQRIKLLQEIFQDEIAKVDLSFFIRLNESKLHLEDKSAVPKDKHPLFIDSKYSDIDYYKDYPTIFHLRKELMESNEPHDIRLVYLAIHNILKHRGHFLIEGGLSEAREFATVFDKLVEVIEDEENGLGILLSVKDASSMEAILKDKKKNKKDKVNELENCLILDETSCDDKEEIKEKKAAIEGVIKLIVGKKQNVSEIFIADDLSGMEKTSFSFSSKDYEENIRPEMESQLPGDSYILDCIKAVYDWSILVHILGNEKDLSSAKVKLYDEHKSNLKKLKELMKEYCDPEVYKTFFHGTDKKSHGYGAYIGNVKIGNKKISVKKCSEEDFYKDLKKILESFEKKILTKDAVKYQEVVTDVENHSLLPLQRSKDNGSIPKQIHEEELEKILDNAATYLPFLKVKGKDGLTPCDKIISIFNFRVPYYVGPLSTRHQNEGANVWIERKEEGRIYPWNFSDKVDEGKTGEEFIRRMTNKCTYLVGEDVIPKKSLLYSSFMVLNELNNLKKRGKAIEVQEKQEIYNDLFMKKNKVTGKQLLEYLQQQDPSLKIEDLSGFDKDFKSSLSPYLDFEKKIFGKAMCGDKEKKLAEDIIFYKTIYGDGSEKSWEMTENILSSKHPGITAKQLKDIKSLRYSGWGRLSKEFLNGIVGEEKATGEKYTIIRALWETNYNLMELLSGKFTFGEKIEKINLSSQGAITKITYDSVVKDLPFSPAVKRAVWQTIQIVEEIKKVIGHAPKKIFVEVPRGGGKKEETKSRKEKLEKLYKDCKKMILSLGVDWEDLYKHIEKGNEDEFKSRKLFLYYLQMGKCMYTGESIDLNRLMKQNSEWDIDHIYPQSKVKDDSLDNIVLSNKRYNNKTKGDRIVPSKERNAQKDWWGKLLEKGFISKEKYARLTRDAEFSPEELGGFINRQLVETRQSTKAVIELLKRLYGKDTQIIPVKAGIVSDFRKNELNMLKCRLVNDYHHAKDAYLNIVVGDVYSTKFTLNPAQWIEDELKKGNAQAYNLGRVFDYDVYRNGVKIWTAPDGHGKKRNGAGEKIGGTLEKIRETMRKNDILYTEYTYCDKGALFDETIAPKSKTAPIPLKKGLDTSKYGGYTSANTSYFALVEFDGKKNERVRNILEVPMYVANMLPHNPRAYLEYCENVKGLKNVNILMDCIKKNTLLEVDGYPMRLRGYSGGGLLVKNSIQAVLNKREDTIRKIEKYFNKVKDKKKKDWPDVDEVFDGLNGYGLLELYADIRELYDDIVEKLTNGAYSKRPAIDSNKLLNEWRTAFMKLNLTDSTEVVHEMIKLVRCDGTTTADLSLIGGGKEAGKMKMGKSDVTKKNVVLVNQSVTGLFERRNNLI